MPLGPSNQKFQNDEPYPISFYCNIVIYYRQPVPFLIFSKLGSFGPKLELRVTKCANDGSLLSHQLRYAGIRHTGFCVHMQAISRIVLFSRLVLNLFAPQAHLYLAVSFAHA